ncbi:nucleotidyltransferase domain-containing protein [Gottschalkia purinilytica]|uniref:Nucleotidyltransferase domain-containing protein n=1 Tax=Gottschalkia purinilytica TaxID=1503 RepID=A0A0L0WAN1_GOTPU|nr:nucleotidyltransferase domain-containing protein [Gottschalkia purinilytica]KNF08502.1 nucleotidyltransferase domain-containing protein [Gottschalkia purinilytica]
MYLSEENKNTIVNSMVKEFNPKFIYLFGSYAKGIARGDSDIDLGIYTDNMITTYELFMAAGRLSMKLKKDVEIINLKDISTVFAAQIVIIRDVLYCEDENLRANYEIRILKDYAKLNEERQVILDVIKEDEKIYEK